MLENKRILAVIPARGGSKGIPRKNLQLIAQKSLLARTIESAKLSNFIDEIVVSSEDPEIIVESLKHGANVPFVRPEELSQDDSPSISAILHALDNIPGYDYIITLQTTSPFRSTEDIDSCIKLCFEKNAPCCVSVSETKKSPHWMFKIIDDNKLEPVIEGKIISRRQDLPPVYALNGAIFLASVPWLLKNKSFYSEETIGYIMPQERSLDIDTWMDLNFANFYLQTLPTDI